MPANIPEKVQHGTTLKATLFDQYVLNNVSRHVYNELGETGRQVQGVMVKGYGKKTVHLRTILGLLATSVNWSIEGRMSRDAEWALIYSYSETTGGYKAKTVNVVEEWDWLRVGCYIDAGTNADNPVVTAVINCRKGG